MDFKGMAYGRCSPTDIDFSVDFQQKCFIFGEIKGLHRDLTVGQRIHLEGLVKGLRKGGLTAYAVFAQHSTRASEDVIVAECFNTKVYDGKSWVPTEKPLADTMDELYNNYLENKQ
jgi:hypothetical protein